MNHVRKIDGRCHASVRRFHCLPAVRRFALGRCAPWIVAAFLAGCGGGGDSGDAAAPVPAASSAISSTKAPHDCSVTLEGDSILYGGNLPEPPAAGLQRLRPAYRVVQKSVPGATAVAMLSAVMADSFGTRVVVLQFGMNDATFRTDYETALRNMVQHVQMVGSTPIVTGISHVVGSSAARDPYDAIAQRVAAEEGAIFADWGSVPFDPAEMADAIHPAQAYSTRLVEQIALSLDKAAPECAQ